MRKENMQICKIIHNSDLSYISIGRINFFVKTSYVKNEEDIYGTVFTILSDKYGIKYRSYHFYNDNKHDPYIVNKEYDINKRNNPSTL